MILASTKDIERYTAQGVWGKVRLDIILQRLARSDADRLALQDPPNRATFATGPARALTYRQSWQVVQKLAATLKNCGLAPGDIVGIQLPPITEAPLVLLACWHAGLIASPLPVPWRAGEIASALDTVAARALITWHAPDDNDRLNDLCRAGAGIASVRAVLAFGQGTMDGVIDLDAVVEAALKEDTGADGDDEETHPDGDANAIATLTWDISSSAGADVAAARSHNEWIAAGIATVVGVGLRKHPVILCPYPLGSLVSIGALMVPWLLNGGTLVLHRPFDIDVMRDQLAQAKVHFTCLPPVLAERLEREIDTRRMPEVLGVHWRSQNPVSGDTGPPALRRVDIVSLAETAFVVRDGKSIQNGATTFSLDQDQNDTAPLTSEFRLTPPLKADGRQKQCHITIRSPMAPSALLTGQSAATRGGFSTARDSHGFMATGHHGLRLPEGGIRLVEAGDCQVLHGGLALSLDELDELYKSHQSVADAAAFTQTDDIMGQRLIAAILPAQGDGQTCTPLTLPDFTAHLHALGVAAYKHPDHLVIVEEIPRDADGKIDRDRQPALQKSTS